ncbi:MAG: hypothetical protein HY562_00315 [Ignavibacteriales bacterium]|nr:hypothetical protein [Ignavibacteriales bacterium]
MAGQTDPLLGNLDLRRISVRPDFRNVILVASDTCGGAFDSSSQSFPVGRLREFFFHAGMTGSAAFDLVGQMEFRTDRLRSRNIVSTVALLARDLRRPVSAGRFDHLGMELVLRRRILVTVEAINRLNVLLVRQIVHVEPGMTGDADEFPMGRCVQCWLFDKERDLFAVSFSRKGFVAMAGEAIGLGLGSND